MNETAEKINSFKKKLEALASYIDPDWQSKQEESNAENLKNLLKINDIYSIDPLAPNSDLRNRKVGRAQYADVYDDPKNKKSHIDIIVYKKMRESFFDGKDKYQYMPMSVAQLKVFTKYASFMDDMDLGLSKPEKRTFEEILNNVTFSIEDAEIYTRTKDLTTQHADLQKILKRIFETLNIEVIYKYMDLEKTLDHAYAKQEQEKATKAKLSGLVTENERLAAGNDALVKKLAEKDKKVKNSTFNNATTKFLGKVFRGAKKSAADKTTALQEKIK